jgi:hypothetical protein
MSSNRPGNRESGTGRERRESGSETGTKLHSWRSLSGRGFPAPSRSPSPGISDSYGVVSRPRPGHGLNPLLPPARAPRLSNLRIARLQRSVRIASDRPPDLAALESVPSSGRSSVRRAVRIAFTPWSPICPAPTPRTHRRHHPSRIDRLRGASFGSSWPNAPRPCYARAPCRSSRPRRMSTAVRSPTLPNAHAAVSRTASLESRLSAPMSPGAADRAPHGA